MTTGLLTHSKRSSVALHVVPCGRYKAWLKKQNKRIATWLDSQAFAAEAGAHALLPDAKGSCGAVLACVDDVPEMWALAHLPASLPPLIYRLEVPQLPARGRTELLTGMSLGWALACYRFEAFRKEKKPLPSLLLPAGVDRRDITETVKATSLVRDLINQPANVMTPVGLAESAGALAGEFKAECRVIVGKELLRKNYPAIYTVGQASEHAPRLIDLRWGRKDAPKVTLVGKGVCFDTGGLDIKPDRFMKLMKKDMGGAAHVLGLARLVMAHKLPVRLRALIPAVENSVSGNAMRPLDVITTRKGLTVEVGHTDAEGRLVLADALAEADSESPEMLIDCATLTGAARVALGTDIPAFFTGDDALATKLHALAWQMADPLWRLPLHAPYAKQLKGMVAELTNDPPGYGGAITAALFLQKFVTQCPAWVHVDMMAWNSTASPGRPVGGEAMGLRALFSLLRARFSN